MKSASYRYLVLLYFLSTTCMLYGQSSINVFSIIDKQGNKFEYPTENITSVISNPTTQIINLRDNTTVQTPIKEISDITVSRQYADSFVWGNTAKGKVFASGTYQSELDASCIVDDYVNGYVESYPWWRPIRNHPPKHYVVIVHDDCAIPDLIANRKIYNKYDAHASFCNIINPFANTYDQYVRVENMKEMVQEGQEFGLHALFGTSYWRTNKLFDIKPDGGSNFAPLLSDLLEKGGAETVGTCYLSAGSYSGISFGELDEATLNKINSLYTIYGDNTLRTGIDLQTNSLQRTCLQWLEYFYNELVDHSLGYSCTSSDLIERFSSDYDIPKGADIEEYYPDKAHLLNGKMVYYADTANANFNNPEYQKVGKFKQGLFKGSFSTCNYEVLDRVIEASKAFMKHYFDFDNITDCHSHGGTFCKMTYEDEAEIRYDNREKTIVHGAYGRFYKSSEQQFLSEIDLFSRYGINQNVCSSHFWANGYEGECGMFFGQDPIRDNRCSDRFTPTDMYNSYSGYLNSFGSSANEEMDYTTYFTFLNGIDDWTKLFYENADKLVTNNGVRKRVYNHLYYSILAIKSTIGTGKIPILKFDTINRNPAISTALELLLRFCYLNDIEVIGIDKAKEIASGPYWDYTGNIFPNTQFDQTLLNYFRGGAVDGSVYYPDGWSTCSIIANGTPEVCVVQEDSTKKMTIQAGSEPTALITCLWGLEPGDYTLRYKSMSDTANSEAQIILKTGGMKVNSYPATATQPISGDYQDYEMHFTIPTPVKHPINNESNGIQLLCNGCEDNVQRVVFALKVGANAKLSFKSPSLTKDK